MAKLLLEIPDELLFYLEKNYNQMGFQNIEEFLMSWHLIGFNNSQLRYFLPIFMESINKLEAGFIFNIEQVAMLHELELPLNVLHEIEGMFEKYLYDSNRTKEFALLYSTDSNLLNTYMKN